MVVLIVNSNLCHAQEDFRKEAHMYTDLLQLYHYSPRTLDEQLSNDVFKKFIEELDDHGLYFTKADLQTLAVSKESIYNDFMGFTWNALPQITELYKKRLLLVRQTVTDLLAKPVVVAPTETVSFSIGVMHDSISYAVDDAALQKRWTKLLKYKILAGINSSDSLPKKEPEVREKVKTMQLRTIDRILQHPIGFEKYVASLYLRSFGLCFDPHTTYMSHTEYQNMQSDLSKEAYSFGLDLEDNEDGEIVIARLHPGGPAWKSNELHKGDILTGLSWEGKETVDLTGADAQEVYHLLRDANQVKLTIQVRRPNGQTEEVQLMKEKLEAEENLVKSYILKGDKKIGYITLPGFYSEWSNASGSGCANDVAKEVVKLKQENVEGLILDIRSNGGGSVKEGLALAGIFIDEGPLFMIRTAEPKPVIMKDLYRGTLFDGPLIVMVNRQSASASEILASTLQDYNRALIVGSTTFGKATTQMILSVDTTLKPDVNNPVAINSPYGFANVTIGKLYRVTGKSCQLIGVKPDVHLPDIYEAVNYGERYYPFALAHDSLDKKLNYLPLAALPIQSLSQKSESRLAASKDFALVKKQIAQYPNMEKLFKNIPLTQEGYKKHKRDIEQWWNKLDDAEQEKTTLYKVENTTWENEILSVDAYKKEVNEVVVKNLAEDLYLQETYLIMQDLIEVAK